jgi:hypothetical protein
MFKNNLAVHLISDDHDIVAFFATLTLYRVLRVTASGGISQFHRRWTTGEFATTWNGLELDQEHLSNGDILVNLAVAGSEAWRKA